MKHCISIYGHGSIAERANPANAGNNAVGCFFFNPFSNAIAVSATNGQPNPYYRGGANPAVINNTDVLRSLYGIRQFTDDPHCVLRIGISPARMPVIMSDGTRVRAGEPIGELHLWNEHIPRYSEHGPDLGWAADMRRRR